ncbi:MAG: sulfite exporter TauE/SafE family protein [Phycisphaerae bacterium]|nr:sulfite exporter TauE/SafE family protein [Phycisphaerae bacterium]
MHLWLIPLGFVVGAYGTLIGAGGGFILVPLLLLFYPHASPEVITSISLAVVFFNAFSGSVAYARMRRIHYKAGLLFAAATIPGAILGALTTSLIPRRAFDAILGILLIAAAAYLLLHPGRTQRANGEGFDEVTAAPGTIQFNAYLGAGLSAVVGYLSSLLGIGGGGIHVTGMVELLRFPVHVATATSHFVLAIMALTGTIVHVVTGTFHHGVHRAVALSIGVVLGAQVGAMLSNRLKGVWIIRSLAAVLIVVAIRVLVQAVS